MTDGALGKPAESKSRPTLLNISPTQCLPEGHWFCSNNCCEVSRALASRASIGRKPLDDTDADVSGYSLRMFQGEKGGRSKEFVAALHILQVRTFKFGLVQVLGRFVWT